MIRFIINIYLATTIASLIAFVLNFRKLDKYLRKQGLQAVFNEDSLVCLLLCFIPILNIKYGLLYYNGAMYTDEEMEKYLNENDLEE